MWKRFQRGISMVLHASAVEWLLVLEILRLLILFRVALIQRSFPDVLSSACRRAQKSSRIDTSGTTPGANQSADAALLKSHGLRFDRLTVSHIGIWIERISGVLPGTYTCLVKALAGYVLYSRAGFKPELRVGATVQEGDRLVAHAWLEVEGIVPVGNSSDLSRYTVFEREGGLLP